MAAIYIQSIGDHAPAIMPRMVFGAWPMFSKASCTPPLLKAPPCNPPPVGGGDHFTVLPGNVDYGGLCSLSVTHTFLHCFPITANQSPVCIL